jgi:integrase
MVEKRQKKGGIEKHGKTYRYCFNRKGIRYRKGGYQTREDAKEAEARARTQAKRINTDFIKLCESRLKDVEIRRSKGHFERNRLLIEKLTALWGTKKEITREDVKSYIESIAEVSHEKANRALALIRALFGHGIKEGIIDYNPVMGFSKYGVDRELKYIPPLEDVKKVLESANPMERAYLITLLHTMGRMREIHNLKWEDVNENYLILRTRKARNSNVSIRQVPLTITLKEILDSLPKESEYVFTNKRKGSRFDNRIKLIKGLCRKANVKEFSAHNLRHLGASVLVNSNIPLSDIQILLGHSKVTTTACYIQSISSSLQEAISKIGEIK